MNLKQVVVNGQKLNVSGGSGGESLPIGSVIMWVGTLETIPTGWHLCNGEDGTFDLRGMFILGAGGKYSLGDEGGSEEVTLTVEQMPAHSHAIKGSGNDFTTSSIAASTSRASSFSWQNAIDSNVGSSQPHPNMPPYKALYYIQKIA